MSDQPVLSKKRRRRAHPRRFVVFGGILLTIMIVVGVLYYFTRETRAVAGDFAVYREATGAEAVTTTLTDQAWDSTVSQASLFSIDAGRTTVTLSEAGHYLALYNLGVEVVSGTSKGEIQGFLNVNGVQNGYGRSSCYLENQGGQSRCWMSGAAIIQTTAANQTIKAQAQRTDDGTLSERRVAGTSGFTLLRLDDDWAYLRARDATGNQAFNVATWATITFTTNDEIDTGFSRTGGDITIATPGKYIVTTNAHFVHSNSGRNRFIATRLTLNGAELPGTRVGALMSGDNSAFDAVASYVGVIVATTSNQVLRLQGACLSEACGKTTNVANGTSITITRLPDTVEFTGVTEAGGGQLVDASNDPILWDTNIEVSSVAFAHSTTSNTSRITVQQSDDYIFFSSFYNTHTSISTVILNPHWEWRTNGSTKLLYGSFGAVNRGDESTYGVPSSGASGGAIFTSLTANDYIEVVNTDESTGVDNDPSFPAYQIGLQGIRLSSLESPDLTVSAYGNQSVSSGIPATNLYVGGSFKLVANHTFPTETITSITVNEKGTVDAQNDLSNIKLYYDIDTTAPYDCASESYAGGETQYGSTDVDGFSSADGSVTFSGSVVASSTQTVCAYVVLDVDSTAATNETVEIEITNPSVDVVLGGGPVGPATPVLIPGTTLLEDDLLTQIHYHWRNDDNNEILATSATGGTEDTVLSDLSKNNPKRIRLEVSNEGTASSPAVSYRLEYAPRVDSCAATESGWADVGAVGGAWDMFASTNVVDGTDTTNITVGSGGVTDENTTFLSPNAGVKDLSSQTANITLTGTQFVELEYSVVPTASAVDGQSYCFRVTDAGTPLASYSKYPEASIAADVLVTSLGSHIATVDASTSDLYIGGAWVITDKSASRDVTSLTLSEVGTVDGQNNLANIRLYYESDVSAPYDCTGESFDGGESQYGATSSAFSAPNGSSVFSQTVGISTVNTMCVYAVLDVGPNAINNETIQLEISNPGTQVVVSAGTVNPSIPVFPTGSTTITKALLEQVHYHFRNDNGTEAGATSATGGIEDVAITSVKKTETHRLRMEVTNEGGTSTVPTTFTLEYAERSGSCAASAGWTAVGQSGSAWAMSDSFNLTNDADTTNVLNATGGVTDENTTFFTPNGGVLDTQATSNSLRLSTANFLELEFGIEATSYASFGSTYCFRLRGEGSTIQTYSVYPQATVSQNQDFYIQRGYSTVPNGSASVSIIAGTDYIAPSSASKAFVRITNTMQTGAGIAAGGGSQSSDVVTTYISNPGNITSSINFTRVGTAGNTRVYWEIIEYTGPTGGDNEMIVRSSQAYSTRAKTLTENIAVSGVTNDADVVVFLTGQSNPQADLTEYQTGIVTTDWNGTTDQVVLERGAYGSGAGNIANISFAVVEFTGQNWAVQRVAHTYSAVGTTQNEVITSVNDIGRAFLHVQHRTDQNTVPNFGHLVWLSGVGTVSFQLSTEATVPGNHTSVAWVIENTQTNGTPMVVTRSDGTQAFGGDEPSTYSIPIGKTLSNINVASIFTNMYSSINDLAHPHAIMGVRIASTTHYELWISDTGASRSYRTEIVEWPTAVLRVSQNYFRFYVDNDAVDPSDPWPAGPTDLGENTTIAGLDAPPGDGDRVRVRMSLNVSGANISQGSVQYKLQYGVRDSSCSAIGAWLDAGDPASTTALWRGYNATPLDGTALSANPPTAGDLNLSVSDRAGTFEEANPTAANPYKILIGDDVEYDWILQANGVTDLTSYCFRMVETNGTELQNYVYYPTITVAGFEVEQQAWRWYDDETSLTPSLALAATNTAPSNFPQAGALKLRVLVDEKAGRNGDNTKYKLQWSEFSDFSVVQDVADVDTCGSGSRWCYFDGAGTEGATITDSVLYNLDTCVGGVGDGCGTHNEYSYAPDIVGEVGTTTTNSGGVVINLQHTYTDPVFIVEAISGDATGGSANRPAVAIITATTTSSFTVRIQEPDNELDTHGVETLSYIVMERGSYQLPDGRRVDVNTIDTSRYYGNAVSGTSDDTCTFTQTFTSAPVILTSLQTNNNTGTPDFLSASIALVSSDDFACSMEVPDGETNIPTSPETIGWIAIEGGAFTNNGIAFEATTTSASITGWVDTPWYEQAFTQLFIGIPGIVANKQTRNGAEGGWVRYDNQDTDSVQFAIDERDDGERTHTTEVVAYLAHSRGGVLYRNGPSSFVFAGGTKKEFEFTLQHKDARSNVTYFFRLYDVNRDTAVTATTSTNYPSISTEGATLSFSINGVAEGISTEGVVTDVTSSATSIPFGSLTLGVPKNAAQRLSVTTNASEGYQILAFERQDLLSGAGVIEDVTGSNTSPIPWSSGCLVSAQSCYGYHIGDNTLLGGSTRFLLNDTYAPLTDSLEEVAYSSGPVQNESTDIIYRVKVGSGQPAGQYESKIVYIVVPVF